jgi:putative transposase
VIEQARGVASVTDLCEALDVSESGYYAWRETKSNGHDQGDADLTERIQIIFDDSRQTYGSNRVEAALRAQGICTSRKRVARLMREQHLRSVRVKKRRACLTRSVQNAYVVENLLAQDFTATRENEKWVTDTTYVPTEEDWLYLVTVLDIFTRQIVGWSMGNHHDAPLATAALTMALKRQQPLAGLILHSDRGGEFANPLYSERCAEDNVIRSMSGSGNCYDNAMAESFFATLKLEAVQACVCHSL